MSSSRTLPFVVFPIVAVFLALMPLSTTQAQTSREGINTKLFDFADPDVLDAVRCGEADDWTFGGGSRRGELVLRRRGTYRPPHRSPHGIALLPVCVTGDFRLSLDVMHRGEETAHRDACLFFGWTSPSRFLYAHVSTRADPRAHQLQVVADADRTPFTSSRNDGVDWGRQAWRRLVLEKTGDRFRVWFDGSPAPVLDGTIQGFATGYIGVGSFDDLARFRNVKLETPSSSTVEAKPADFGEAPPANTKSSGDAEVDTVTNDDEFISGDVRRISDDGGWCWFEGPRAVIRDGKLFVGSVASGWLAQPERRGDIELHVHDIARKHTETIELHDRLECDDHDQPALLFLPDGRLLTAYSKHGSDTVNRIRRSFPADVTRWEPETAIRWGNGTHPTYSNLVRLEAEGGRIYNFFRGLDAKWKPSWMASDDEGVTWKRGGILLDVPSTRRHRPYAVYTDDGRSRVHIAYTDGHPRNYDNSVYHVVIENGSIRDSTGNVLAPLREGLARPDLGERVFIGDANAVAWVTDTALGADGHPRILFTVQKDGAGLPAKKGGDDHRFHHARFDGARWHVEEIAFAGRRLYAGEDDYTGLGSLDPRDPDRVVISTDAHPTTGAPLLNPPGVRVHELFVGTRRDGRWIWRSLTKSSAASHLRPICVADDVANTTWVVWLRGRYETYQKYRLEVLATELD